MTFPFKLDKNQALGREINMFNFAKQDLEFELCGNCRRIVVKITIKGSQVQLKTVIYLAVLRLLETMKCYFLFYDRYCYVVCTEQHHS